MSKRFDSTAWRLPSAGPQLREALKTQESTQEPGSSLAETAWLVRCEMTRREFTLTAVGAGAMGLVGVLSVAPFVGFFGPPRMTSEGRVKPGWVGVGTVGQFDETPKAVSYAGESVVYVYRLEDNLVALSATCQHLGCFVKWVPTADAASKALWAEEGKCKTLPLEFCCPCHHSQYDITGMVLPGSPAHPKNLIPQKIRIKDGGKVEIGGNPKEWKITAEEGSSLVEMGAPL